MQNEEIISGNKTCPYEGTWYPHGEELTIDGIGMICLDGRWEDNISGDEIYPFA